jgi:hypothetical protein
MKRLVVLLVLAYPCFSQVHGIPPIHGGVVKPHPVTIAATLPTSSSFVANWKLLTGGSSYTLDVSTSIFFSTFVGVYNNYSVTGTSQSVTGLTANTMYFYRINVVKGGHAYSSNVTTVMSSSAPAEYLVLTNGDQIVSPSGHTLIVR